MQIYLQNWQQNCFFICIYAKFFVILQRILCAIMKRAYCFIVCVLLGAAVLTAQQSDPIAAGLGGVASVVGESQAPETTPDSVTTDSAAVQAALQPVPEWKKKLYYGYNFDIYFHHDSRSNRKENGWSVSLEPELGWKLKERIYLGFRVGGSYQDMFSTYTYETLDGGKVSKDIRIRQGTWNVTPYVRYRLKTMFNDKVGIWIESHLYAGMEFPRVTDGVATGTDYEGLRHSIIYGAQVSPVITYQFNRKSTFQVFFSILSLGYSGTTFCYEDPANGKRYNEYTNDVIIFSGKLRNLIANQFTPGLYGFKFGVQKNF